MQYKIYTLKNPITDEIRYVGITKNSINIRLNSHIHKAKKSLIRTKNTSWIKSLLKKGIRPKIELLDEVNSNWQFWEQYWISQFKSWGFKLNNHTIGGDGYTNYKPSKKALLKLRKVYCKYDLDGNFIKKYSSITEAALDINSIKGSISNINKRYGYAKGYQWRYFNKKYKENIGKYKLKKSYSKIQQYSLSGEFIKEWNKLKDIEDNLNIRKNNIHKVLKNKRKTAGNFQWKYSNDENIFIEPVIVLSGFKKKIVQINKNGDIINIFDSLMDAEKITGVSNKNISCVLTNKSKTAGGFKWRYKE